MAEIAFTFNSAEACRVANLITNDIEKLERELFGTVTNWQSKYERPFKAHYANDLIKRVLKSPPGKITKLRELLPHYEARAEAYTNNPKKKGRPLTTFVMLEIPEPEEPRESESTDNVEDQLAQEIAGIISDNVPVPTAKQRPTQESPKPQAEPTQPAQTNGMDPEAFAAMQALMQALAPKTQKVEIDEDKVREIARDEASKTVKPTVIHVKRTTSDGESTTTDLGVQHKSFPMLLTTLQAGFPVWMPGPAGSGKTTAAHNAARAMSLPFRHTGAVDNVYQLLGFIDAAGTYHRTTFREAYEHGGVFLWDEVDASNPAALVAFNAALENGSCVFPDGVVTKHADCYFIAAANTYGTGATHEYVGRTKIDAATVDRFVMLEWDYDEILERAIAGDNEWTRYVQNVRRAIKADGSIKHLVTPRASIRGNALLAAGLHKDHVIDMTVRKGLPADTWARITRRL